MVSPSVNYRSSSILFFFLIPILLHAQKGWEKASIGDGSGHKQKGLAFYKKEMECGSDKGLMLKIVNESNEKKKIRWRNAFLLKNGWEKGAKKDLGIEAKEELAGTCDGAEKRILWVPYPKGDPSAYAIRELRIE